MKTQVATPRRPAVTKEEMGAEATTILQNIESLLQELQSMGSGPSPDEPGQEANMELDENGRPKEPDADDQPKPPEPAVQRADEAPKADERIEGPPDNPNTSVDDIKRTLKAIITGSPDASTGSSPAQERVEDLPKPEEENLDDVEKAIYRLLTKGANRTARKSYGTPASQSDMLIVQMAEAMQQIAKEVKAQGTVVADILDGLGVTKQLNEAAASRSAQKPVQSTDNALVMREFVNALTQAVSKGQGGYDGFTQGAGEEDQASTVRKNMNALVLGLREQAGGLWDPN